MLLPSRGHSRQCCTQPNQQRFQSDRSGFSNCSNNSRFNWNDFLIIQFHNIFLVFLMQENLLKGTSPIFRTLILLPIGVAFYYIGNLSLGFQSGPSLCLFNKLAGFPCPTCGLTRSLYSLATGNLSQSVRFNPLGLPLACFITLWTLGKVNLVSLLKRLETTKLEGRTIYIIFTLLLLSWSFNIIRVVSGVYPG